MEHGLEASFGSAKEPRGKRPRGEEEMIGNGLKNNTSEGELIGDQAGGRGKHRKRCLTGVGTIVCNHLESSDGCNCDSGCGVFFDQVV
ncbi:hypothetical protein LWI29_031495 [Acer saccharum]|uniref:Uncharacterized protein n=1 Tax=Acer saccharum TaxID=4024 RepID=A0AA39VSB4_ACESA|nr:hypothetical protein LWI29_031495 [Acer saccharum]